MSIKGEIEIYLNHRHHCGEPVRQAEGPPARTSPSRRSTTGDTMAQLIHEFIFDSAARAPHAPALRDRGLELSYAELALAVRHCASALLALGAGRSERIAVYLEKREEAVSAMFGAAAAGTVLVPVNPLLKPEQVAYILADCNVRILVTSAARLAQLGAVLASCADLQTVVLVDAEVAVPAAGALAVVRWNDCMAPADRPLLAAHRTIDSDMAAILYTSGSTGKPKGVVLSHRNMVAGALSVSAYLANTPQDRILCLLPLSFDYGLSQLTTAFASGACAVLMNYLLAREIIETVQSEAITGLAGVPPLWIQLAHSAWPAGCTLRYITNSGGAMPRPTLDRLRACLPQTRVYLMYGLTEAFRSTYLAPEQLDERPGSIGKAIPNAEVLVLRPDGALCGPDEPGELVHRGALVALGYWNDRIKTAERFKPLPAYLGQLAGLPQPELAVWSGDTVRSDEQGYLYFVGRSDDMIKSASYRISPSEIEEVVLASGLAGEAAAFGVAHPTLGQAVVVVATPAPGVTLDAARLQAACKLALPGFMQPAWIDIQQAPLPRNPNGKIDRKRLAGDAALTLAPRFAREAP